MYKKVRLEHLTYLSAEEAGENVANLVNLGDDPGLGGVGGNLVLNPSNEEIAD